MNARALHEDAVVVDAHNDLPVLMLLRNSHLGIHSVEHYWRDVWVPEAREGGVNVQVLPIYCAPGVAEASLRHSLLQVEAIEREAARTPAVALCRNGVDIDAALAAGQIALIVALEGTPGIGIDVDLFAIFHRLGVRMASFTHWSRALLADGTADEDAGSRLPHSGVRALAELERLGILLDVSHLAAPAVDHVLELATTTIVASHSSARALRDHHRNLSDEHLRAIAATGGVIGINVLPVFIDPQQPTLDRVADHVEHIAEVAGIDHVGLGPDFLRPYMDAVFPQYDTFIDLEDVDMKAIVPGLARTRDLPNLTETLAVRGWSEPDLRKVLGANWLRVFRALR
ncbi:MAG: dipeptidase [Gaiellaceae bacterium]